MLKIFIAECIEENWKIRNKESKREFERNPIKICNEVQKRFYRVIKYVL